MRRGFSNILCAELEASAGFYEQLLGLARRFSSDWFILLGHDDAPGFEFGLIKAEHEIAPAAARGAPAGVMATFVVEDCDAVFECATGMGRTCALRQQTCSTASAACLSGIRTGS